MFATKRLKEPIVYEHNGNEYTMTEIDYHLGKVIEKNELLNP